MSEFVGFDSETANRIVAATRKVEAHPFGRLEPLGTPPTIGTAGRHNIVFRVTSSTITDGMWPIRYLNIETLPAGNPALDFVLEGTEGWGYGLSGASLQLGVDYFGSFVGYKPTDNRAVFVTGVSSGGSGSPLIFYEIDFSVPEHTEINPNMVSLAFPAWDRDGYFDLVPDPVNINNDGLAVCLSSPIAYACLIPNNPGASTIWNNSPPFSHWDNAPNFMELQVGHRNWGDGVVRWRNLINGSSVTFAAGPFLQSFNYILPLTPVPSPPISGSDPVLARNGNQMYWSTFTGGGLDVQTIEGDGEWTDYIGVEFSGITSISFADKHMAVDPDPNNLNGVVVACRPLLAYSVLASAGNSDTTLWNNQPPRSEFTDEPNTRKIYVGHENEWDGEITFLCEADASECTFRTTTDAGPIIYLLPNAQDICDGKMLMTGGESAGQAQLSWFFPSIEVTEGGAGPSDIMVMDFTNNDFDLIKTTIGSAPCEKGKVQVSTNGLTASRNVYKYQCVGTTLQQQTGTVVIEHGLIKSWTPL